MRKGFPYHNPKEAFDAADGKGLGVLFVDLNADILSVELEATIENRDVEIINRVLIKSCLTRNERIVWFGDANKTAPGLPRLGNVIQEIEG